MLVVVAALEGGKGPRLRAVATTDLVARPHAYLNGRRVLMVNFGRSGNSAETLGTLDLLDVLAPASPRLNITCNAGSALATRPAADQRVIVLPEATHDAGFAMTSSFSTMLLTALAARLFIGHRIAGRTWAAEELRATRAALMLHVI